MHPAFTQNTNKKTVTNVIHKLSVLQHSRIKAESKSGQGLSVSKESDAEHMQSGKILSVEPRLGNILLACCHQALSQSLLLTKCI